jgi:hypothetical protein
VSNKAIPERAPIGDRFSGLVVTAAGRCALAQSPQPETQVTAAGDFIVRYGVRFLGKPHESIIPGLIVVDYGEMLTGEEAWDFLLNRSNRYPRAEVIGFRSDGRDDMVFFRQLDLSLTPEVLLYTQPSDVLPLARPTALIAAHTAGLPPRLLGYLPVFASVNDWLKCHE